MTPAVDDPVSTLDAAERTLKEAGPGSLWARATAHLTRQALEGCVEALWREKHQLGLLRAPMRTQLVCLPFFVDPDLARRVAWTWEALSEACHHHGYEMAPGAEDLVTWLKTTRELADATR